MEEYMGVFAIFSIQSTSRAILPPKSYFAEQCWTLPVNKIECVYRGYQRHGYSV